MYEMRGVPIIVALMVLLKIIFNFLRINLLNLKVGFVSLFQCEIKPIH